MPHTFCVAEGDPGLLPAYLSSSMLAGITDIITSVSDKDDDQTQGFMHTAQALYHLIYITSPNCPLVCLGFCPNIAD